MDVQVLNTLVLKLKVLQATNSGPEEDVGQALLSYVESATKEKELELERVRRDLEEFAGVGYEFQEIAKEYASLEFKK